MGISERKEREKLDKKQLIRSAAMKMFLEDGYAKTSIRKIADAIEYSPGTIYLYYKDKDELLYDVQHDAFNQLLEAFKTKAKHKDPVKRLMQIGQTYVSFGLQNPELYDLMFIIRAPTNVDEELHKDNGEPTFDYLVDCLKECIDKDLLRMNDVQLCALQTWSVAHGLVSLDLRCRLKVMSADIDKSKVLNSAIESYVKLLIK
ncbi:TetR/AcrR family transcriptional regulator [Pedobacter sp. MC2016-15]|uniref:TetR/AcrR family transcriptional regulator n=1 Tax=Pedobacter sp. MC2016-15 TaxID=2994473 RepID=UPI002246ABA5|nr:TetR/AcrR family transcriptional regulator [Pedobacter sp. MC2016-15]MCX2480579.1 TetR/AcrR family transcriptional regulator [Pedobacter sp. MC2016-15]